MSERRSAAPRVAAESRPPPPADRDAARHVAVVLHDVAPARWDGCTRVLRQLRLVAQQAGVTLPLTLLVVPHHHGQMRTPQLYLRWLHGLARAGHELALHGLTHRDESAPPGDLRARLLRTVYTAGEGEFAALSFDEAARRLDAGRAWAQQHGLTMPGFVAPAWLMSAAALDAVAAAGFDYTCTLRQVIALPGRQALTAPNLVYSTRAPWRRALSLLWARVVAAQAQRAPLLRLELHPTDADHPAVMQSWSRVLAQALHERRPLRLRDVAARVRGDGTPFAHRRA